MLGHGPSSRLRGPGQDAAGAPGRSGTRHGQDSGNRPGRPPAGRRIPGRCRPAPFPVPTPDRHSFLNDPPDRRWQRRRSRVRGGRLRRRAAATVTRLPGPATWRPPPRRAGRVRRPSPQDGARGHLVYDGAGPLA